MGEELEFAGLRQLREKYESDEAQADPAFGGDIVLEVEYFRALRGAALSLLDTAEKAERVERERDEARQQAERAERRIGLLEAVRNAAATRAYECDCQGRDVKLDDDMTIHLVMEGCSHDDALHDALDAAFAADYETALAADPRPDEAGGEEMTASPP